MDDKKKVQKMTQLFFELAAVSDSMACCFIHDEGKLLKEDTVISAINLIQRLAEAGVSISNDEA